MTDAKKIAAGEGRLDWGLPAVELERAVRALNPWPGKWFTHGTERIRVLAAEICEESGAPGTPPGTVLDDRLAEIPILGQLLAPLEDLDDRPLLHNPPGIHDGDLVTDLGDHSHIVGDKYDCSVGALLKILNQMENLSLDRHI